MAGGLAALGLQGVLENAEVDASSDCVGISSA